MIYNLSVSDESICTADRACLVKTSTFSKNVIIILVSSFIAQTTVLCSIYWSRDVYLFEFFPTVYKIFVSFLHVNRLIQGVNIVKIICNRFLSLFQIFLIAVIIGQVRRMEEILCLKKCERNRFLLYYSFLKISAKYFISPCFLNLELICT